MAGEDQQGGKVRTSAAAKRKAKKDVAAPTEAEPAASAETSKKEVAADAKAAMAEVAAEVEAEDAKTKVPKRQTKANRFTKDAKDPEAPRGVVYLGHVPLGFYEPEMRQFFRQFGEVTRLRLSRSKKNAASKGYAFLEFEELGVAKIVAETMHNYLLFGRKLVCKLIPKATMHPGLFRGCNKKIINRQPERRAKQIACFNDRPRVDVNGVQLPQQTMKQVLKSKKNANKLARKLQALDIPYSLDADDKADDAAPAAKKRKGNEADAAEVAPKKKKVKKA